MTPIDIKKFEKDSTDLLSTSDPNQFLPKAQGWLSNYDAYIVFRRNGFFETGTIVLEKIAQFGQNTSFKISDWKKGEFDYTIPRFTLTQEKSSPFIGCSIPFKKCPPPSLAQGNYLTGVLSQESGIPFNVKNTSDATAELSSRFLQNTGVPEERIGKIVIQGTNDRAPPSFALLDGNCAGWNSHIATTLTINSGEKRVLDPLLDKDRSMSVEEWESGVIRTSSFLHEKKKFSVLEIRADQTYDPIQKKSVEMTALIFDNQMRRLLFSACMGSLSSVYSRASHELSPLVPAPHYFQEEKK